MRFIGLEVAIEIYVSNPDLSNYNHWIYGKCNNNTDAKGIEHLINSSYYFKSACIRKYYNKTVGKYYETNSINFRWPSLNRGCANSDATYYGIILEKCSNDSLRTSLEKKICKSDSEINNYIFHTAINLKIINHIIDVFNYDEPYTKYFNSIRNELSSESYIINHLNFNPVVIKTRKGILFEKIEQKHIYLYDINEKVTKSTENTGIYMAFYFWMQNSMQYYERKYELLQDSLSDIGGITRLILSVASLINYIISYYVTLVDTEKLFFAQKEKNVMAGINNKSTAEKKIKKDTDNSNFPIGKIYYNNYFYQNNNAFFDINFMNTKLPKEDIDSNNIIVNLERNENNGQINIYLLIKIIIIMMKEKDGIIQVKLKQLIFLTKKVIIF